MQQNLQQKKGLVKSVFDTVYNKYDLMNDFMSLGVHRYWKKELIRQINPSPNDKLVDVACVREISQNYFRTLIKINQKYCV